MAMNFPNNPDVGDLHQPAGSPFVYEWTGVAWKIPEQPAPLAGEFVRVSPENTLAGQLLVAVVPALPATPDPNTIYFVTT